MAGSRTDDSQRLRVGVAQRPDGVTMVTLAGYLDAGTFDLLEDALDKTLDGGHSRIIVNMSKLTYISSAGAGVLLAAISRARSMGGDIALLKPCLTVADVFALIGMNRFCAIADTLEKAEEILRSLPS
jgi:anti-sigma B factor antagonist